ncbi:MAG: PEP-CTERM sorting domain-containing protein [Aquabacterium sp.]
MTFLRAILHGSIAFITSLSSWATAHASTSTLPEGIAAAATATSSLRLSSLMDEVAYADPQYLVTWTPRESTRIEVASIPASPSEEPMADWQFLMQASALWDGSTLTGWHTDSSFAMVPLSGAPLEFGAMDVDLSSGEIRGHGVIDGWPLGVLRFDPSRIQQHVSVASSEPGWQQVDLRVNIPVDSLRVDIELVDYIAYNPGSFQRYPVSIRRYVRWMSTAWEGQQGFPVGAMTFEASFVVPEGAGISVVPEPGTMTLSALGLAAISLLAARARTRRPH